MSGRRTNKPKVDLPHNLNLGRLASNAKKIGIFVLAEGGVIDFIDDKTAKSLGVWHSKPYHRFIVDGMQHSGSAIDALKFIADRRENATG